MTTFDPFTATQDEARAALGGPNGARLVGAWVAAQTLLTRRDFYLAHPIDGMALCARHDLVAPEWLAKVFLRGFDEVLNCRSMSWDEAFGSPYPKSARRAALRRQRLNRIKVANEVQQAILREPAQPIDDGFWERVGSAIGEGKTRAQELHAEAVALGIASGTPSQIRSGLGWSDRLSPANSRKLTGIRRRP